MPDRYYDQEGKTVAFRHSRTVHVDALLREYKQFLDVLREENLIGEEMPPQVSLFHRENCPRQHWHHDGVSPVPGLDDPNNLGHGSEYSIKYMDDRAPLLFKNEISGFKLDIPGFSRCRVLTMKPRSCYSIHRDASPRAHIPIQTNEKVWFIVEGAAPFHLPADGSIWIVDTTRLHTAIIGSTEEPSRIHIMASVATEFEEQFRAMDLTK